MSFYKYAEDIISKSLKSRNTLKKLVEKIRIASLKGQIAFYPCGRYTRIILNEIKNCTPELLPKIIGCFDKSSGAIMQKGMNIYNIRKLDEFKGKISLLVVLSNTFYSKEMRDIEKLTNYRGSVLSASKFDITIPDMQHDEMLSKIKEVQDLLADRKSKITYIIAWLSRLLNDENLTYLFENEEIKDVDINNPVTRYKGYMIGDLNGECKKELNAEIYKMKYVEPLAGDTVFDIGAYKGDTAIFFADCVGKKGRVYSFEPVKANYNGLVKNIKQNRLDDVVVAINKGCSAKPGLLKAVSATSGAPWAFLANNEGTENTEVTTIDEFVKSNRINKVDFIKMDVEGFEEDVLLGAIKTIKRFRPKLAVPLYHKTSDLFTIPLLIDKLANYTLYIRYKIEGPFGITLYGVKR